MALRYFLRIIIGLLLLSGSASGQDTTRLNYVFNKHIEVLGGLEKVLTIKSVQIEGTSHDDISTNNPCPITIYRKTPNKWREEVTYPNRKICTCLNDGTDKLVSFPTNTVISWLHERRKTEGQRYRRHGIINNFIDRYITNPASFLKVSQIYSDTSSYYLIEAYDQQDTISFSIDAKSFLLVREVVQSSVNMDNIMTRTKTDVRYTNYQPTDGILFPKKAVTLVGEPVLLTIELSFDNYILNPHLPDHLFDCK